MIKLIITSLFAIALVLCAVRFFPTLRFQIQSLLQNPFVRAILLRGLWKSYSDIGFLGDIYAGFPNTISPKKFGTQVIELAQ